MRGTLQDENGKIEARFYTCTICNKYFTAPKGNLKKLEEYITPPEVFELQKEEEAKKKKQLKQLKKYNKKQKELKEQERNEAMEKFLEELRNAPPVNIVSYTLRELKEMEAIERGEYGGETKDSERIQESVTEVAVEGDKDTKKSTSKTRGRKSKVHAKRNKQPSKSSL